MGASHDSSPVAIAALETLGSGDARECGTDSIQKNTICALAPSLCSPSNAVSNATHRLEGLPPLQKTWDAPSLFAFFGPNAAIPQHVPVGERQPAICAFGFGAFGRDLQRIQIRRNAQLASAAHAELHPESEAFRIERCPAICNLNSNEGSKSGAIAETASAKGS